MVACENPEMPYSTCVLPCWDFRSSQHFKDESLVPFSPPLQHLATAGAEGTIRTIGAWLRYKVPAMVQLKGHLLPSAELGPAWESSAEELA